ALALAEVGGFRGDATGAFGAPGGGANCGRAAAAGGLTAAGAALAGAPASGVSPFTDSVLILRGSLFGSVPLPALAGGGAVVDTLAAGGGLLFWFSGGNTTRGPERALTST